MTTDQLRNAGIEALKRELGVVGMVRFLQMFETGQGDYTGDRHEWLDNLSREEVLAQINALQQGKPE